MVISMLAVIAGLGLIMQNVVLAAQNAVPADQIRARRPAIFRARRQENEREVRPGDLLAELELLQEHLAGVGAEAGQVVGGGKVGADPGHHRPPSHGVLQETPAQCLSLGHGPSS